VYQLVNWVFDILNRIGPLSFQTPGHRSFGNGAEELFYGLLKAKRKGKKVLFLYPRLRLFGKRFTVANTEMYHLRSHHAISNDGVWGLIGGLILSLYVGVLRVTYWVWGSQQMRGLVRLALPTVSKKAVNDFGYRFPTIGRSALWKPHHADSFSWSIVKDQNWARQFEEYTPPRLSEPKRRYAEGVRIDMGIPLNDWFVCCHASEYPGRNGRSVSIHNYIEGIRAITEAGGWVVRLGDQSMTRLPPLRRVIDYAFSERKSAMMDMYLLSECRFYLGHSAGPFTVANLLRKPMVIVNTTDWGFALPLKLGDLFILKHVFSHKHDRLLSLREVLEQPFNVQALPGLDSPTYTMVENTPDEIREVIEEFLDSAVPYEYSDKQVVFNEARRRQVRRWLDEGEPLGWGDVPRSGIVAEQYKIASVSEAAAGTVGRRYVERNWQTNETTTSVGSNT
jgi:putative glycosyltransferase (TIGR04372 family)